MHNIAMESLTFRKSYEEIHFKENKIYFSISSMLKFYSEKNKMYFAFIKTMNKRHPQ